MSVENVVIRRESPDLGQGVTQAISARTGWEYEHDETNAQIDAIEDLILTIREEEAGRAPVALGALKRGDTFTWTSSTDEGDGVITIGTAYIEAGEGVANLGRLGLLEGHVWVQETWQIDPAGKVTT